MSVALAVALLAMTSLALAMLLVPLLLRRQGPASSEAYNLAVYRDQLAEVERDLARGLLSGEQAEATRAEIARRILALKPAGAAPAAGAKPLAAVTIAVLVLPIAAWSLYSRLGSPASPDQPFAARGAAGSVAAGAGAPALDMKDAVAKLAAHLKDHPDDLTAWLLLGRAQLSLGNYQDAAGAYRRAVDLSGHRADISGDWGEALVMAAGGTVTPEARTAFTAALNDKEAAPRSRYYLALAQLQAGDPAGALAAWRRLAAESPADAEWLPLVRQRIAQAASLVAAGGKATPPGPAEDAAPPQQQAMIDAMVEGLAARLAQQPGDFAGWVRLGRSYMVLHKFDKAREAYGRALKLRPGDAQVKEALAAAEAAASGAIPATPTGAK